MAFSVTADIEIWGSEDGKPDLPAENHSMLFRFRDAAGEEVLIGANALDDQGRRFSAGSRHNRVTLTFWAEEAAADLVHPGDSFVVWYGRDVGHGRVLGDPQSKLDA